MTQVELFELLLPLMCKGLDESERLVPVSCRDPEEIPRAVLARLDGRVRLFVRHDVESQTEATIRSYEPDALLLYPSLVKDALGDHVKVERFRSHTVPAGWPLPATTETRIASGDHPEMLADFFDRSFFDLAYQSPVHVVQVDGVVVSACMSWRETPSAAEAWVATAPRYRKRGYGKVAVAAWALDCHERGRVAFYSHKETNVASASIASSLRLPEWCRMVLFA